MSQLLPFERLFGGRPLLAPTTQTWESGVTFNCAAVLLAPTPENLPAFRALLGPDCPQEEIVVLHYRARPVRDPDFPWTRSYIGVSVHKPDLTPIRRFESPVVSPSDEDTADDYQGVEDPRVTLLDNAWWMAYCGVMPVQHSDPVKAWRASVCIARSYDLVNWHKFGCVKGLGAAFAERTDPASVSDKDGVIFPDRINGKVVLLHRPMLGDIGTWKTSIALADNPEGPYEDLGPVHGPFQSDEYWKSWVGAGAVPIKIGEGRYVSIEHTGNFYPDMHRIYVLDAFLYDFNNWDPEHPETLVAARMDGVMRPETDEEIRGPFHDSVANVVFACGAYLHDGWMYIVYGGGDTYILAARIRFETVVKELESREVEAKERVMVDQAM